MWLVVAEALPSKTAHTGSAGRSVTEQPKKSMSRKTSRLNGQMPVDTNPDIIFFGVKANSKARLANEAIL
ncbi:hypothetical protein QE152_g13804 [Popillia japonica]|uniref:Uncharacterized protein n=1 Tax=Popillia japonica TaxID=7064 RepID=A0AAW1LBI3_POPJA